MACELTKGRFEPCKEFIGGVKKFWLLPIVSGKPLTISKSKKEIEDITTDGNGVTFYEYLTNKGNGIEETANVSSDNGTVFYTISGTLTLRGLDADMQEEIDRIARANVALFVMTNDNKIFVYGINGGLDIAPKGSTGTAKGDLQGYTLAVSGEDVESAYTCGVSNDGRPDLTTKPTFITGGN